jgi:hypothetical protein
MSLSKAAWRMHGGASAKSILLPHFSFRSDKALFDVCGYRRKANQAHQANIRRRVADNGIVEQGSAVAVSGWSVKRAPAVEGFDIRAVLGVRSAAG